MTKVLKLNDDVEVEVEVDDNQINEISDAPIDSSVDKIQSLVTKVMRPFSNTYKELNKDMSIESAKVSIGIKIGVEGNFILAKSTAGANIQVEITMKASR